MIAKTIMVVIALAIAFTFLAVPIVKLKDPALVIVVLIGAAMMIVSAIEFIREKDEE